MAGLKEFYCRSNETSLGSQFKWLEYTFKLLGTRTYPIKVYGLFFFRFFFLWKISEDINAKYVKNIYVQ